MKKISRRRFIQGAAAVPVGMAAAKLAPISAPTTRIHSWAPMGVSLVSNPTTIISGSGASGGSFAFAMGRAAARTADDLAFKVLTNKGITNGKA